MLTQPTILASQIAAGARFEGTLRNHMINYDGHIRDTAMFSIIAKEWPDKKKQLQLRLL